MTKQDHARRSHRLTVLGLTWNINATGDHGRGNRPKSLSTPDHERRRNAA